jgi:hypothetical protein
MLANMTWVIHITSGAVPMGDPIECSGWDVLSKLAAIRAYIPEGWQANAYPEV